MYIFSVYQETIRGLSNTNKGYIQSDVENDINYHIHVDDKTTHFVKLYFYTYFGSGKKLRIRAINVKQIGIGAGSSGVSGLRYDDIIVIEKII